jgi:alkanesulfonate monooxygenase SsuD/methylene tetrahydromethanopterin reductase-like flavin-dependent oxidoreductase (luciferase family)
VFRDFAIAFRRRGQHLDGRKPTWIAIDCPHEEDRLSLVRHWTPSLQSQTRSAADTLLQSIDLAVAAEELVADGAYFRVHHFARQLASPFPLLAAVAKTSRIEIGTAVIDMRYENPFYMAEDAGAADLIAGGRLQPVNLFRQPGPGRRRRNP